MGFFRTMPFRKIVYYIQLIKVQVRDGQMGKGGPKGMQLSCDVIFVHFWTLSFFFFFFPLSFVFSLLLKSLSVLMPSKIKQNLVTDN